MAKTKFINIGSTPLGFATKVEVSPDMTDAEETKTFDGPIVDTPESTSWEVTVDKIRYAKTINSYKEVEALLLSMLKTKQTVKITEKSTLPDGDMTVITAVYNCVLTDKKYTIDAESRTVENLTFKGTAMHEWVNNELIY